MKKKVVIAVLLIIAIITTVLIIKETKKECNTQAKRFKELYEKYNNKEITNNGKKYKLQELDIDKENKMIEINKESIYKKLSEKTSIIFLGSPKDYTSREMLKVLLEISKDNNCETIYYYDINKLNDKYKKGEDTELYGKITEILGDKITNNFEDSENKKIEAGTIIFSKNGEIKTVIEGVSENYDYGKKINSKQKTDLKNKINEGFGEISGGVCEVRQQC